MNETKQAGKWRRLVAEQKDSGLGGAAFCRDRGIKPQRFYNWKSTLKKRDAGREESPGFVQVVTTTVPAAPPVTYSASVRLHIAEAGTFELDVGFDTATFAKALTVVRKVTE